MDLIEEALSTMIFFRNTPWDFMEVTLSADDLAVLGEVDGKKSLGAIAGELGKSIQEIMGIMNELGRLKLIRHEDASNARQYEVRPPSANPGRVALPSSDGEREQGDKGLKRLYRGVTF